MDYSHIKIKVCGLTKLHQINQLIQMEVDYLGFIFYPKSPRYILNHLSLEALEEIDFRNKVGVFVNEPIAKIVEVAEAARLGLLQLHGNETAEYIRSLKAQLPKIKIIKGIGIGMNSTPEMIQNDLAVYDKVADYLLFDREAGSYGGTGLTFPWEFLNRLHMTKPYFLSGGVSKENVLAAAALTQLPYAFDINSKFENEPGDKDLNKIKIFKEEIKTIKLKS